MISRKIFILLFLLLVVFLEGCDVLAEALAPLPTLPPTLALPTIDVTSTPWPTLQNSPTPTITSTPAPTRTRLPTMTASATMPPIIRVLPNNFPADTNPLTGYPVADLTLLDRKPVIVKISNYPHSVRPQWGLSLADHLYEYYLEDGLTRFAAVFYGDNATQAGPIRSGRIFDATLMQMYNAIVVFNGADQKVVDYFNDNNLTNNLVVERPGVTPLWRDNSLPIPHNLFGNTAEISAYVTERGSNNERPDLVTNAFYSLGNYGKDWAMQINVNYSYANYAYWQYNTDSGRYVRYQGNADNLKNDPQYELLTDSLTGFPIAVDNVVILFVPHEFFYKSSDTEIFDIKLTDRGEAYVFRDGKANPAIWVRTDENLPLSIQDTGGSYFPLKPGVTFFQIIHTDSITTQDSSTWTFDFVRPTPPPE